MNINLFKKFICIYIYYLFLSFLDFITRNDLIKKGIVGENIFNTSSEVIGELKSTFKEIFSFTDFIRQLVGINSMTRLFEENKGTTQDEELI